MNFGAHCRHFDGTNHQFVFLFGIQIVAADNHRHRIFNARTSDPSGVRVDGVHHLDYMEELLTRHPGRKMFEQRLSDGLGSRLQTVVLAQILRKTL